MFLCRKEPYGNESKGVRFDVYAEDEHHTCYDVEMQAEPDSNLPKRSRYYHSCMDMEQLLKGNHYSELKRSVVIFICKDRISEDLNLPVYTYRYQSQEDPSVYLDDDTLTVIVNGCSADPSAPDEMKEFLNFIRTGEADTQGNSLTNRLRQAVDEAKQSGKWSVEYMRWDDDLKDRFFKGKQEGIAEGRAEGRTEGRTEMIISFHKNGMSKEDIARYSDIDISEITDILKKAKAPV